MRCRPLIAAALMFGLVVRAEEGMWTFDNPPLATIKAKYGFDVDEKWLEHIRLATLEFGSGSAAFVSKDGLVLTNHHVGRRYIEKVSTEKGADYFKTGFVAKTRTEEIKIPDLSIYTLMQMTDVTEKVNAAVKPGMDDAQATGARMEMLAKLRKSLDERDGLLADHVVLYHGGEYWIYSYKAHRDVRLVMAPEEQIAFFGGDTDNFTYPRHDMDICLFRVYEGGEPYRPPHYLKWQSEGLKPGDLTFVVGRPGETQRLKTVAELIFERDYALPSEIKIAEASRSALQDYGKATAESARKVATRLFSVENNLKRASGELSGLQNPAVFAELERKERDLRAAVATSEPLQARSGKSWARIEETVELMKPLSQVRELLNSRSSLLMKTALDLVRCVRELDRPVQERLQDYRKRNDIEYAKWRLLRSIQFDDLELETFLIARGLEDIQRTLGPDHPFRVAVLGNKTPDELAKEAVSGTKLHFMWARRDLVTGSAKGIAKSQDPLVKLARTIEEFAREIERKREDLQAISDEQQGRIAQARFAIHGKKLYPDATHTIRFSYGAVEGYVENGIHIAPFTQFEDLYQRAALKGAEANNGAWALPPRWIERKASLNLKVPLNFCHKVDIVGGNSGSPVINIKGEYSGIAFDGNIQSLPGTYYYDGGANRAVSVDARAIIEALTNVYDAKHLSDELLTR